MSIFLSFSQITGCPRRIKKDQTTEYDISIRWFGLACLTSHKPVSTFYRESILSSACFVNGFVLLWIKIVDLHRFFARNLFIMRSVALSCSTVSCSISLRQYRNKCLYPLNCFLGIFVFCGCIGTEFFENRGEIAAVAEI